jgi:hypothetical protein
MASVSLYCGTEAGKGEPGPMRWGSVEIEFSTTLCAMGRTSFRVYRTEPTAQNDGKREQLCHRELGNEETRKFAEALKGLLA